MSKSKRPKRSSGKPPAKNGNGARASTTPQAQPIEAKPNEKAEERADERADGPTSDAPSSDHDTVAEISAYVPEEAAAEAESLPVPRPQRSVGNVADELRDVDAEVDRLFAERPRRDDDAHKSVLERLREAIPVELPGEDGTLVDAAKDVLSTDYYLRQWGRIGLRNRSEEVDEFGLDPVYEKRLRPLFELLYKHYFRVEVSGVENVPESGRCILVSNHSGVLPYDGIVVRTAMRLAHAKHREVRWLAEDFIYHLPFLGAFMNRIGAVRACQENAERLLKQERCILVFPEGIKGIGKLFSERYQLQRFGRGGFVKLAIRTRAPLIPVSIIGAEEASPMLFRIEYLTQILGLPFVPVTPTFPLLGPLGLVPAPTKWKITFGKPIDVDEHGSESADDALLVGRLADRVRSEIQASLAKGISERKSVWFG